MGNNVNSYKEGNYEFYILQVMNEVCEKHKYPIKQKYAEAIAEYRNEHDPSMDSKKFKFKAEDVRPNMSRALDRLCKKENPPIICFNGKYYVPNNAMYLYERLSEEYLNFLKDRIIVDSKEVLLMSYNVCAFWARKNPDFQDETEDSDEVEEFEENGVLNKTAHKCIAECLGEYGFGVFGEKSFIQVMVKCTTELGIVPNKKSDEFAVIRALENAVSRIYENQHRTIKLAKTPDFQD